MDSTKYTEIPKENISSFQEKVDDKQEISEVGNITDKKSNAKTPKRVVEMVPPDGSWGWIIVLGGFITIVLGSFPLFSFSILFSPLLMSSEVSSAKIAWIFNIHQFIWSIYTLFLGPLSEEYGWRRISIIGGIANFLSIFLSVFVVNVDMLFITFSIFGGIGGSTGFTVCFLAVSRYFVKHRGFAIAITTLGSTLSSFLGPLVANYLLEKFGYMGASLIYSALVLNQCVGGALFQPVEWHMKPAESHESQNCELASLKENCESNKDECDRTKAEEKLVQNARNKIRYSVHSIDSLGHSLIDVSTPNNYTKGDNENSEVQSRSILHQFKKIMKLTYENLKTLKYLRVKLIAVAYGCLFLGYVNFQMWIPFLVTNAGYSLEVAAWCASIGAIANAVGKIGMSVVSDRKWFNVRYGFMLGVLVIGTSVIAFSFIQKLELFLTIACVWGFGVGMALSLFVTAMISVMGVEMLPALLGVSSLFKGIINLGFGPLVGHARDIFSSYIYAMCLLGGVELLGFCLWLFMPLAEKLDRRKARNQPPPVL